MCEVEKKGVLVEWAGAPVQDGAVPDGAVPDGAAPDGVVPDGVVPDGLALDGLALDGPAGAARGHVIICPGGGYQLSLIHIFSDRSERQRRHRPGGAYGRG